MNDRVYAQEEVDDIVENYKRGAVIAVCFAMAAGCVIGALFALSVVNAGCVH